MHGANGVVHMVLYLAMVRSRAMMHGIAMMVVLMMVYEQRVMMVVQAVIMVHRWARMVGY